MGHVCPQHAGTLNPDYGSCAPLHFNRNTNADRMRAWAGGAERMAAALRVYAAEHRRAAELSDLAKDSPDTVRDSLSRSSRLHAADGRAALHAFNILAALRDRIVS